MKKFFPSNSIASAKKYLSSMAQCPSAFQLQLSFKSAQFYVQSAITSIGHNKSSRNMADALEKLRIEMEKLAGGENGVRKIWEHVRTLRDVMDKACKAAR
ncbi:MAG: hypothetical protein FWD15_06145 [Alphaproteobacteria bacterium]|nr:hypothetical protein [Alphaproteobacteria bacterium]